VFYHLFQATHFAMAPARAMTEGYRALLQNPFNPFSHTSAGRSAAAAFEVFERTTRRYEKPAFGLQQTIVDGKSVAVTEEIVWRRPFCDLIHFKRAVQPAVAAKHPKILLVAPMSGHYATLLRGTVETYLPDHEVYITDWLDARDVAPAAGSFDLDDYIDYMMDMFRHFKGDVHVFAVCQPSVPVMAAIARMEADSDKNTPHSVTLAGGPIDTRKSPTVVNQLAVDKGLDWFKRNVINTVPWPNSGVGRRVYPGFLQLSGFMSMNLDRHVKAHKDLYFHLVDGDDKNVEKHVEFYDEYLAVMDLTAEFYLQTIDKVFVNHQLPMGTFKHRGKLVDLTKIKTVALMTVEGENDDITGTGQCRAAIDLCTGIPAKNKQHFECPKVGHYGVFNGSRFRSEIAPRMRHFFRRFDPRTAAVTAAEFKPHIALVTDKSRANRGDDASAFTFANGKNAVHVDVDAKAMASEARAQGRPANVVRSDVPRVGEVSVSLFDPFAPFAVMSPMGSMKLWSEASQVFFSNWSAFADQTTPVPAQKR
jgi:poly(3-hydroxybutyrate) depolymerase